MLPHSLAFPGCVLAHVCAGVWRGRGAWGRVDLPSEAGPPGKGWPRVRGVGGVSARGAASAVPYASVPPYPTRQRRAQQRRKALARAFWSLHACLARAAAFLIPPRQPWAPLGSKGVTAGARSLCRHRSLNLAAGQEGTGPLGCAAFLAFEHAAASFGLKRSRSSGEGGKRAGVLIPGK